MYLRIRNNDIRTQIIVGNAIGNDVGNEVVVTNGTEDGGDCGDCTKYNEDRNGDRTGERDRFMSSSCDTGDTGDDMDMATGGDNRSGNVVEL